MKKLIYTLLGLGFLVPALAYATTTVPWQSTDNFNIFPAKVNGITPFGLYLGTFPAIIATTTNSTNSFFIAGSQPSAAFNGFNDICLGYSTCPAMTIGQDNVVVGDTAGHALIDALSSTFVGVFSGTSVTSGNYNAGFGSSAVSNTATGTQNTGLGTFALSTAKNDDNTGAGYNAGLRLLYGSGNTFLGSGADLLTISSLTPITNASALGFNARVNGSNMFVLGGTGTYGVNVGIGTTTPGTIFSIGSSTDYINISSTATSTFSKGLNITSGCYAINGTCVGGSGGSGTVNSGVAGQVAFYNSNGTAVSGTSTIFITPAGNVGIGTISPSQNLEIKGSNAYDVLNASSTSGQASHLFQRNGTTKWQEGMDFAAAGTNDFYIYDQANSKAKVYLNSGNVSIGGNAFTSPNLNILDAGEVDIANGNLILGNNTSTGSASPTKISLGGKYSTTGGSNPKLILYEDGSGASSYYGLGVSGGQMDLMVPSAAAFSWYINNTKAMSFNATGLNIGNTATPSATLTVALPAAGTNSYLKLTSATASTFNSYLGTTASNQYAWFTNIKYNGSAFVQDDATKNAWRMTQVVDSGNQFQLNHWDTSLNLTTPFNVGGDGSFALGGLSTSFTPPFTGSSLTGTAAGNIGIGVATALNKLQVNTGTDLNFGIRTGIADGTAIAVQTFNDAGTLNIPLEIRATKTNVAVGYFGIGSTTPFTELSVNGTTTTNHIQGVGPAPTIVGGTGMDAAGGGTISLLKSSTDLSGVIYIKAGPTPTTGGVIFTLTFNKPGTNDARCVPDAYNGQTPYFLANSFASSSPTTYTRTSTGGGLLANNLYAISYVCAQ